MYLFTPLPFWCLCSWFSLVGDRISFKESQTNYFFKKKKKKVRVVLLEFVKRKCWDECRHITTYAVKGSASPFESGEVTPRQRGRATLHRSVVTLLSSSLTELIYVLIPDDLCYSGNDMPQRSQTLWHERVVSEVDGKCHNKKKMLRECYSERYTVTVKWSKREV